MKYHTRSFRINQPAFWIAGVSLALLAIAAFGVLAFRRNAGTALHDTMARTPANARSDNGMGMMPVDQERDEEANPVSQESTEIQPASAEDHFNQGNALVGMGKLREAIPCYQRAVQANPNYVDARYNLANALRDIGYGGEAMAEYRSVLEIDPHCLKAIIGLARLKATCGEASLRNGDEAAALAQAAVAISQGRDPNALDVLAVAYAETGRFSEAAQTARQALALAAAQNDTALVDVLLERIKLYGDSKAR